MIKTTAIGYLGKDAVLKDVNGKTVVNFSIAHSEKYKNKDGVATEKTLWIECALWESEKIAPYLKSGTQVYIEGQPDTRAWADKDGELRSSLIVRVHKIELLGGKKDQPVKTDTGKAVDKKSAGKQKERVPAGAEEPQDDLPF